MTCICILDMYGVSCVFDVYLYSRYVRSKLGLGVLASLANSFDQKKNSNEDTRYTHEHLNNGQWPNYVFCRVFMVAPVRGFTSNKIFGFNGFYTAKSCKI